MWKKIWKWVLAHEPFIFLLAFTFFFRIPTLFEPYWYGDEGIYLTIGHAIAKGEIMYRDVFDHKPPLIYYLAALVNGDQFWWRFLMLGWNIATVGVFYFLSEKLFPKKRWLSIVLTVIFILFTNLPLLEGNIANGELFFLLPTLLGTYLLFTNETLSKKIFWGGLCFGLAGLFKIPALVELGIWPVYWFVFAKKDWLKKCVALGVGVVLPFAISFAYFAAHGVADIYLAAAAGHNVWYVTSWGTASLGGIYELKVRAAVCAIVLVGLLFVGKKLGKRITLVAGWLSLTVFGVLISGRPYPHYVVQMIGAFVLAIGVIFVEKKWQRIVMAGFVGLMIVETIVVLAGGNIKNIPHYSSQKYYLNFADWITGKQSKEAYFKRFDSIVPTLYEIAGFIQSGSSPDDKIFVWGDQSLIYALSKRVPVGKYTTKFHLRDAHAEAEIFAKLQQEKPIYIVSYGHEDEMPGLWDLLQTEYKPVRIFGEARIYRYMPI